MHPVALLPLGTLSSAVRIPGRLVLALTGSAQPWAVDVFLGQVLDGGPVNCDPYAHRYYALGSASMPTMWWHQATEKWRRRRTWMSSAVGHTWECRGCTP